MPEALRNTPPANRYHGNGAATLLRRTPNTMDAAATQPIPTLTTVCATVSPGMKKKATIAPRTIVR